MLAANTAFSQDKEPIQLSQESFNSGSSSMESRSWHDGNDPENPYNWSINKKWALTCLAAFTTFLTMMNGTIITVAHVEISEVFNVNETAFPHSYWPVTTWAVGVHVPPYSFSHWRRISEQDLSFTGGCVAILANTAAGVMGNLWDTEWSRSVPVSLYILGYMAGSSMGPVMGAAIYHFLGWRWISYMQIIWFGALLPIYYVFFYESRGTAVLARRAKVAHSNNNTGSRKKASVSATISEKIIPSATRPVILVFTEPVLFVSTMWSAFTVGTLFLFTQSVEQVFLELYDWNATQTGFVQAAIVIGELIGWGFNLLSRTLYFGSSSRNTEIPGTPIPEARLYMAVIGGIFGISGGMFAYAWTSYSHIPWIAPTIGLGMVGAGSVLVVSGVSDYVVDAYSRYSGSAMGAVATGENIFSAFLPLATMSMYNHLGLQWASTLLALIALVLSLIPTLMFVWSY
ncbi:hypothetical protein N7450_007907 [Penicillium hetheringtonii]|uniref:Major facilitator superfamily (MFS) profile domain-containing protein n=1 Tax=Penicillium hetheringtonii TaxID=911720 RepID=A0AAD6DF27_9EURO|nr:hypothetical protein N7450_007907 [Penicillium hetheringtonii]